MLGPEGRAALADALASVLALADLRGRARLYGVRSFAEGSYFGSCPRDPGGHCLPSGEAAAEKPADKGKFVGKAVGKAEHVHAAKVEGQVARATGGTVAERVKGKQIAYDVKVPGGAVEVKSMLKGGKTSISVHDDALARKVAWQAANPGQTFHTVVVDERKTYEGGAHAENYSGNRVYYRRGSGRFALGTMYAVKSAAELKRLISTPDHKLPEKARGSLPPPPPVAAIRAKAEKAHAARLAKDRARKARLREERQKAQP